VKKSRRVDWKQSQGLDIGREERLEVQSEAPSESHRLSFSISIPKGKDVWYNPKLLSSAMAATTDDPDQRRLQREAISLEETQGEWAGVLGVSVSGLLSTTVS
jgi:hypothetical protein